MCFELFDMGTLVLEARVLSTPWARATDLIAGPWLPSDGTVNGICRATAASASATVCSHSPQRPVFSWKTAAFASDLSVWPCIWEGGFT